MQRLYAGQLPLLERLLRGFVQLYAHGEPALVQHGTGKPPADWSAVSHSLRGACSSIGCVRLAGMLQDFEQRLGPAEVSIEDTEALAIQARQLHEELLRLVAALNEVLQG